jgi:hypothetical protein
VLSIQDVYHQAYTNVVIAIFGLWLIGLVAAYAKESSFIKYRLNGVLSIFLFLHIIRRKVPIYSFLYQLLLYFTIILYCIGLALGHLTLVNLLIDFKKAYKIISVSGLIIMVIELILNRKRRF